MLPKVVSRSFLLLLVLVNVSTVEAQPAPEFSVSKAKSVALQAGTPAAEVEKVFGAADAKSLKQGTARESWYYGGAVIFFLNGVVTAWSDDGSLVERQAMSRFQTESDSESDVLYEGGWLNAWTPQEPLSRTTVLNELIQSLGGQ